MGLVFFIPFVVFLPEGPVEGLVARSARWPSLSAAGSVGALGWFMVASGLQERPGCEPLPTGDPPLCGLHGVRPGALDRASICVRSAVPFGGDGTPHGQVVRVCCWSLLVLQIVWGAFTAGLDAGRIYNTWPLMNGEFMPENVHCLRRACRRTSPTTATACSSSTATSPRWWRWASWSSPCASGRSRSYARYWTLG